MVFAALRCKRPKWLVLWGLMRGVHYREQDLFYAPDEVCGLCVFPRLCCRAAGAALGRAAQLPAGARQAPACMQQQRRPRAQALLPTACLPPTHPPSAAAHGGARGAGRLPAVCGAQRHDTHLPGAGRRLLPAGCVPAAQCSAWVRGSGPPGDAPCQRGLPGGLRAPATHPLGWEPRLAHANATPRPPPLWTQPVPLATLPALPPRRPLLPPEARGADQPHGQPARAVQSAARQAAALPSGVDRRACGD